MIEDMIYTVIEDMIEAVQLQTFLNTKTLMTHKQASDLNFEDVKSCS